MNEMDGLIHAPLVKVAPFPSSVPIIIRGDGCEVQTLGGEGGIAQTTHDPSNLPETQGTDGGEALSHGSVSLGDECGGSETEGNLQQGSIGMDAIKHARRRVIGEWGGGGRIRPEHGRGEHTTAIAEVGRAVHRREPRPFHVDEPLITRPL